MRIFRIISGVILTIAGIVCFASPGAIFSSLAFLLGCAMLIAGLSGIFAYIKLKRKYQLSSLMFVEGTMNAIFGCLVLSNQLTAETMISVFFGMWIIFSGLLRITASLNMVSPGQAIYKLFIGLGMISVLVGIFSFINAVYVGLPLMITVGIIFVIQGINVLTAAINMPKISLSSNTNRAG